MRKFMFLFMLLPFVAVAKFYPATVTMNDGSIKSGYVERPEYNDNNLKFRMEEKGNTEKLSVNDVKEFEITFEKNEKVQFRTLILTKRKAFNSTEIKVDKDKSWVRVVKAGIKGEVVWAYAYTTEGGNSYNYYYHPYNSPQAKNFWMSMGEGLTITVGAFKSFKKNVDYQLTDCPGLSEKITKENLDKEGLGLLARLYDENCN